MRHGKQWIAGAFVAFLVILAGSLAWNRSQPRDAAMRFASGKIKVFEPREGVIGVGVDESWFHLIVYEKGPAGIPSITLMSRIEKDSSIVAFTDIDSDGQYDLRRSSVRGESYQLFVAGEWVNANEANEVLEAELLDSKKWTEQHHEAVVQMRYLRRRLEDEHSRDAVFAGLRRAAQKNRHAQDHGFEQRADRHLLHRVMAGDRGTRAILYGPQTVSVVVVAGGSS
jgi:hypothetical protein